jgi:glucokinase
MYKIGVDLGGTNIATAIVDEKGKIVAKISIPTLADRDFDEIIDDIAKSIKMVLSDAKIGVDEISSIGIGMPGTINTQKGTLVYANNFKVDNSPIVEKMKKHFNLPIYIGNDANCAALGEAYAGGAVGCKNMIMITLGTGVGGGIIIDGKIYEGVDSAGAELGHNVIQINGEQCNCGRKGCIEAYASATGLIRETKKAISENSNTKMFEMIGGDLEKVSGRTAFAAAKLGDKCAIEIVDKYILYLGEFLVNMSNTFRPEMILLGGGVANEGDNLYIPLQEFIRKNSYAEKYTYIPVVKRATLGNDAGIIGAAMLS